MKVVEKDIISPIQSGKKINISKKKKLSEQLFKEKC